MDSTAKNDKITQSLSEIESLLLSEHHHRQAGYIAKLRELYCSALQADRIEFERLVTTDKYLWLGMGTIADIILTSEDANLRFGQAYFDFATECERLGLRSIYTEDLLQVFRRCKR